MVFDKRPCLERVIVFLLQVLYWTAVAGLALEIGNERR